MPIVDPAPPCAEIDFETYTIPTPGRINFEAIADAALRVSLVLVRRWLPDGEMQGQEWVARNPRRSDRTSGSFKINLQSGKWCDFATGDRGRDLIALSAFLFNLRQGEAAKRLAVMLDIPVEEPCDE